MGSIPARTTTSNHGGNYGAKKNIGHCFLATTSESNLEIIQNVGVAKFGNRMNLDNGLGSLYVEDEDNVLSKNAIDKLIASLSKHGAIVSEYDENINKVQITDKLKTEWLKDSYEKFVAEADILAGLTPYIFCGSYNCNPDKYDINLIINELATLYNFSDDNCVHLADNNSTYTIDNYIRQANPENVYYIASNTFAIVHR